MTTEHDPRTRIVLSWLREDAHENAEIVLLRALDEVDTTPQPRSRWSAWRANRTETYATLIATTAAVLVVAIVGFPFLGFGTSQGPASPGPSSAADGSLPVGPHVMGGRLHGEDRVTVTIPGPGWFAPDDTSVTKDLGGGDRVTVVVVPGDYYAMPLDICDWQTDDVDQREDYRPGSADDLVAHLATQTYDTPDGSLTRAFSAPEDITIDGSHGRRIRTAVPGNPDSDASACDEQRYCTLQDRDGSGCLMSHVEPSGLDTLWVVDPPEGIRNYLLVVASDGSPSTALRDEMDTLVDSMTFYIDPTTSPGPATPGATPSPSPVATATPQGTESGGGMWPQSDIEEARAAQVRADAGDPDYTWQSDPQLVGGISGEWADHVIEPGIQIAERFLRDELGWDAFMVNPYAAFGDVGPDDGVVLGLAYLRCAPGQTNPLYPNASDAELYGADRCAPTLDPTHYETVSIDLLQPVRRGADAIWVVSGWRKVVPFAQVDPTLVQAQAEARLQEFLLARVDGDGAEELVAVWTPSGEAQVPLLYATTGGAAYERFEFGRVGGPQWPSGNLEFELRLYAEDGTTVVSQRVEAGEGGTLSLDRMSTTENGRFVPQPRVLLDGRLTVLAPRPWALSFTSDGSHGHSALDHDENDRNNERIEFVDDPLTAGSGCSRGKAGANAAALADSIRSDPDLVATAPVTVTVSGQRALSMDITAAPGADPCAEHDDGPPVLEKDESIHFHGVSLPEGMRMRLYLLDAPAGSGIGTLAIAVVAFESSFDAVLADAAPIVESMQFEAP